MKNPLQKRLPRELKSELGKYLVIFLLLVGSIGFVSGFLVADGSMIIAYNNSFEKYKIEDGNFRTTEKLNKAQKKAVEEAGVTLYDNFYVEESLTNGSTMRIFSMRREVDLACLMSGAFPEKTGEIAIDRMYADNNQLEVGDSIKSGERTWKISGLIALSDYSCLFANNNDSMFDSVKFGVSVVAEDEFATYDEEALHYKYSWRYGDGTGRRQKLEEKEEKKLSEDLLEVLVKETSLNEFVPCYLNQAIQFTGEDMGGDRAMMIVLLYIVIAIMAFVFGVTISNTIVREANVIGTLRASGYTKGELIRHYMMMPILVTLIGAVAGNLLGYTIFKDVCVAMYYGSYSLPTYETIWNGEAFCLTTVVPVILMFLINFMILHRKLRLSPLQFLRRDLSGRKRKRAIPLSPRMGILSRFRLRIIFQNLSNYVVLFVGILFANLLLMFGLLLPSVLENYQKEMESNLLSNYQYILQMPVSDMGDDSPLGNMISMLTFAYSVETENEDAEKFSAYSLNTISGKYKSEEILLYGIQKGSRYISLEPGEDEVYISSGFAEKFAIEPGDTVTLKEKYEDGGYSFRVTGIYDYVGSLSLFMSQEKLNQTFDLGEDYFSGYFSDTEITDIDEKYINSVIDAEALTKISRQLTVSMGGMMNLVNGFAVIMFMILIYLLSRVIIEKNAQSISMTKILGYTNGEIGRLYIVSTTIVVIVFLLVSLPVVTKGIEILFFEYMMTSITGWITFYIDPFIYVEMFLIGIATYAVVAILEYRKIAKVPMDEALKHVE
ncbi:FtsX-like permease family protein [Roseburia hominis]